MHMVKVEEFQFTMHFSEVRSHRDVRILSSFFRRILMMDSRLKKALRVCFSRSHTPQLSWLESVTHLFVCPWRKPFEWQKLKNHRILNQSATKWNRQGSRQLPRTPFKETKKKNHFDHILRRITMIIRAPSPTGSLIRSDLDSETNSF